MDDYNPCKQVPLTIIVQFGTYQIVNKPRI
ncbi:hypothetical protein VPHF99_0258 [Vibrio phage F99]